MASVYQEGTDVFVTATLAPEGASLKDTGAMVLMKSLPIRRVRAHAGRVVLEFDVTVDEARVLTLARRSALRVDAAVYGANDPHPSGGRDVVPFGSFKELVYGMDDIVNRRCEKNCKTHEP